MVAPTVELAKLYTQHSIPVYLYIFDHMSEENQQPAYQKSFHTLEMNYVFGSPFMGLQVSPGTPQNFTDQDRLFSKKVMQLWSDFIRNGWGMMVVFLVRTISWSCSVFMIW